MSCEYAKERNLLKFSSFACFCFAALGVGIGLWAGSMAIVFDGAYSLVSLFLSLMALGATVYISNGTAKNGKSGQCVSAQKAAVIESLVVLIKGLAVSVVCVVSFASAFGAMFNGGREVNAGFALIFGVVNLVGCMLCYQFVKKNAGKQPSTILKAEASQWLMDTVISAAVLVGFIVAAGLMEAGFTEYAIYADPIMVILASVYFATVPVKMVGDSTKRLWSIYQQQDSVSGHRVLA
ncbi:cobalt-zinc-cadmium resistance protein [Enterovibrio norvegicus FF-162]|uniref:cation transporter n=1 Tax=Enterovibrio norvegicus TaxID=188144 RepID=UPI0002D984A4|nr:cation transporter [Enterovibrio norvegicus]OEE87784.1 cobalt-zinc-cadmium resistance protein [Enterovibrio norvegicus FF-162]